MEGKLKYLINKKKSLQEICTILNLQDYEVIGLIILLKEKGYMVDYLDGEIIKVKKPTRVKDVYQVPYILDYLKLCLISDTHLCSNYDRLDLLNYIYEKADKTGVKYILHCGDFTDGKSNRIDHIGELKEDTYDGQVDYCVEKYPYVNGVTTYVIQGNHDDWWFKQQGQEILKSIASQRKDIIYLGSGKADLKIGSLLIRMLHSKGYSFNTKNNKASNPNLEIPALIQHGHIHQSFYMKKDSAFYFQTGALEDLTPYFKSRGYSNDRSCWWLDIGFNKNGEIVEINPKLEIFGPKLIRKKR